MRHAHGYRKLGKESSHRRAMLRNLTTSVLEHGRIKTTVPKAKEVRRLVDKMVTLGKRGDLHARRQLEAYLFKSEVCKKVVDSVGPRMKERNGGYTRIIRLGERFGDGADMCQLELVDFLENEGKV